MHINFRQGVVSYPISGNAQAFLVKTGSYVSLRAGTSPVNVAFAHRDTDYLLTETQDLDDVWGPIPSNTLCWLYWDIDLQTAERTFGFTTVEPLFDTEQIPGIPDQHWFDTTNMVHYVYGSGVYREVVRCFAGTIINSTFAGLGVGFPSKPHAGSQVGIYTQTSAGHIIADNVGVPILRTNGTFFTTESDFFLNGSTINPVRLEATIVTGAALEMMAKFQVVKFTEFGQLNLARYDDIGTTVIAMLMEDLSWEDVGNVCVQGKIENPNWNWTTVGAPLWVIEDGLLTENDPHVQNAYVYPQGKQPIARVLTPTSIIFDQGLGGKGDRGEAGLSGGVPLATTTVYGISRLSVPAADSEAPIVVGTNDPRLDNKVLKTGDTMTGPLILHADPIVNLGAATKQYVDNAIQGVDLSALVQRSGDTMTGFLTLHADPTNPLHSVTKQYVDSKIDTLTAPYDISMLMGGQMGEQDEISTGALIPRTVYVFSAAPHIARAMIAPTLAASYTIVKITNGISTTIGSLNFLSGATVGSVTINSNVTLVAGDTIAIKVATATPDVTIQNVFVTIVGCAALDQCSVV